MGRSAYFFKGAVCLPQKMCASAAHFDTHPTVIFARVCIICLPPVFVSKAEAVEDEPSNP